jgi:hypothetical protein
MLFTKTPTAGCNDLEQCTITEADSGSCGTGAAPAHFSIASNTVTAMKNVIKGYSNKVCITCVIHENLKKENIFTVIQDMKCKPYLAPISSAD